MDHHCLEVITATGDCLSDKQEDAAELGGMCDQCKARNVRGDKQPREDRVRTQEFPEEIDK